MGFGRKYPIWHEVQACHYKTSKSYGGVKDSRDDICVGTSSTYSYRHASILTTKREKEHPKYGKCWVFKTSMDGIVLKETWVSIKTKKMVRQRTKLNSIKSLKSI